MKHRSRASRAFSLVEVALALGVAAFALLAVMGTLPVGLKTQQASVNQTKANAIIAQITDFLRSDVRLPSGLASKACDSSAPGQTCDWSKLHGHWLNVSIPDTLFFTNDGTQNGYGSGSAPAAPANAVFRATITYLFPPTATTSIAKVSVSWPAQVDPTTAVPAGSAETFVAVNR
jgi:type II secretory pathway pseudopilin PulG